MIKEVEVTGDAKANAKQLAHLMSEKASLARVVAMAFPYYASMTEGLNGVYADKVAEVLEDEFHEFIQSATQSVF